MQVWGLIKDIFRQRQGDFPIKRLKEGYSFGKEEILIKTKN